MQYRLLGNSGLAVSTYALGTMTFGAETPESDASAMLTAYAEAGGRLIETADVYAGGESESIVGRWLKSLPTAEREKFVIAAKGRFPVGVEARDSGLNRRHLRRALDASLRRLDVDHVDLYQVHSWDPLTPIEETVGFLESAVQSGKVSYVGLSNLIGWQISAFAAAARGRFPLISMQPQYNLFVREVEWEIVPASVNNGLGLLPWSPLGGGWLTGKYQRDQRPTGATRLGEDPNRGVEAYDLRGSSEQTWDILDTVKAVAERHDTGMAQVALAWLHDRPGVSSVILGVRTLAQLQNNLLAVDVRLTPEEIAELDEVSAPAVAQYPYGPAGVEQRSRTLD